MTSPGLKFAERAAFQFTGCGRELKKSSEDPTSADLPVAHYNKTL
jgi:hypothetical protein